MTVPELGDRADLPSDETAHAVIQSHKQVDIHAHINKIHCRQGRPTYKSFLSTDLNIAITRTIKCQENYIVNSFPDLGQNSFLTKQNNCI